jgi:hypothetical protein
LPAQFLHSQKSPDYLQLNQLDTKVLSPGQDDTLFVICGKRAGMLSQVPKQGPGAPEYCGGTDKSNCKNNRMSFDLFCGVSELKEIWPPW